MEHNWIYIEDYDFGRGDILQCNYCHLLIIVLWNNSRKLLGQPTNIEWVSDNLYTKYKTDWRSWDIPKTCDEQILRNVLK